MPTQFDAKLMRLANIANQMTLLKQESDQLRNEIYGEAFADKPDGSQHTLDLGNGYKLKGKRPLYYKLDDTKYNETDEQTKVDLAIEAMEAEGNEGSFIAERLIKFKPELSVSEYKGLLPKYKAIVDPILTITPGLPEVRLEEPKAK